jgi:LysM repeat protein
VTSTLTASITPFPTATPLPTLTPTPVTYQVGKDDTMGVIAYRFGISVAALETANPSVNPRAMGEGLVLVIPATPLPQGMPSPTPLTPTPLPYSAGEVQCYPTAGGGLWCFMLVKNEQADGLENVTGKIVLSPADGSLALEQDAVMLINILPGEKAFPLAVFFANRPAGAFTASGSVTGALPQPADDTRYLSASLEDEQVIFTIERTSARLTGTVKLLQAGTAVRVWVAAAAYGSDGSVVGLRKWETEQPLESGSNLAYDFTVYSLVGEIDRVELFVEAQP